MVKGDAMERIWLFRSPRYDFRLNSDIHGMCTVEGKPITSVHNVIHTKTEVTSHPCLFSTIEWSSLNMEELLILTLDCQYKCVCVSVCLCL